MIYGIILGIILFQAFKYKRKNESPSVNNEYNWRTKVHSYEDNPSGNEVTPRLEIRWRDELDEHEYIKGYVGYDAICDLCLVYRFGEELRYEVMASSATSEIQKRENLDSAERMKQDAYALMYQLKVPCFVSFQENFRELKFPDNKLDLAHGVTQLMNKDKIH